MATSADAMVKIETSNIAYTNQAMVDSGDHTIFKVTGVDVYSGDPDIDVKPDGILSGINLMSPESGATNNEVEWPAFTAQISGVSVSVSAGSIAITRPATAVAKVCSIIVDGTGTVAVEAGTDGATTTFSEVRGAAGGPPLIQVADIELAQVRVTSDVAAVITAAEIFQNPGQHSEYVTFPPIKEKRHVGKGDVHASVSAEKTAYVEFASALPLTHVGAIPKGVFIDYATPNMTEIPRCLDYTPSEVSHGVNSTTYYGGTDASTTRSLGQGGFTVRTDDNIRDFIIGRKDDPTVIEFYPDRNKVPFQRTMATLGMARTFPAEDQNQCVVTMTSLNETSDFTS